MQLKNSKKRTIHISLFLSLLFSCKDKKDSFIYYDLFDGKKPQVVGSYKLYSSGYCQYYVYYRSDGKRHLFKSEDVIETPIWSLHQDTLILMRRRYFVRDKRNDTISFVSEKGRSFRILKSPYQSNVTD